MKEILVVQFSQATSKYLHFLGGHLGEVLLYLIDNLY